MKRLTSTLAAVGVAAAFAIPAFAQDKPTAPADSPNAGKTQQAPKKSEVQGKEPSAENMDSNAQRAHSRSTPAASASSKASHGRTQTAQLGEVRNWAAIDKNKDHLIEPDEMQAYLDQGKKK